MTSISKPENHSMTIKVEIKGRENMGWFSWYVYWLLGILCGRKPCAVQPTGISYFFRSDNPFTHNDMMETMA